MAAAVPSRSLLDPVERVISVLCLLLYHERGRSRSQLRREVEGYQGDDESFEKLFAWDRRVLSELGVRLIEHQSDDEEPVLRVDRDALTLPRIDFDEPERRALELAATVWDDDALRRDVSRAVGLLVAPSSAPTQQAVMPRVVPRSTPQLDTLMAAAVERRWVGFDYRDARGALSRRRVRAWATVRVSGQWYLVGWDADRHDSRTFRLSRIETDPRPEQGDPAEQMSLPGPDFSLREVHDRLRGEQEADTLRVWVQPGRAQSVRVAGVPAPGAEDEAPAPGWEAYEIPVPAHDGLEEMLGELLGRALPDAQASSARQRLGRWWEQARRVHAGSPDEAVLRAVEQMRPPKRGRRRSSALDWAARFLDIVGIANREGGVTRAELRERFGLSEAELTTHLQLLRFCGLPERYYAGWLFEVVEDGDVVRIEQAEDIDAPLRLTRPEAHRLIAGLATVEQMPHHDPRLGPAARRAADRIRVELLGEDAPVGTSAHQGGNDSGTGHDETAASPAPASVRAGSDAAEPSTESVAAVATFWDVRADPDVVRVLDQAVRDRRVLSVSYHSVHGDRHSTRVLEPVELFQEGPRLYLSAWCRVTEQARTFRVDRITRPEATNETFSPGRRHAAVATTARPDHKRTELTAVLRFAHRIADLADEYGPVTQARLEDGSRLVEVGLVDAAVAHGLVGAHGGDVEVILPAALRVQTRERIDAALTALADASAG